MSLINNFNNLMEGFEQALNYVSQIDNSYGEEKHSGIINDLTYWNYIGIKEELTQHLNNLIILQLLFKTVKKKFLNY